MAISQGRSATAAQTISTAFETAFEKGTDGAGANLIQIKCLTESVVVRINSAFTFLVQAGESEFRRTAHPEGIVKVEVKRALSTDATLVWDMDVIIGSG